DYRGLVLRSPWMVVTLSVFLLSLLGIPPLAGFVAKFQIFSALFNAGQDYTRSGQAGLGYTMYALLVIGGLNTVLSVFYYLKVMKVMIIDRSVEDVEGRPAVPLAEPVGVRAYALLLAVLLVVAGVLWDPLATAGDKGAGRFHRAVKPA